MENVYSKVIPDDAMLFFCLDKYEYVEAMETDIACNEVSAEIQYNENDGEAFMDIGNYIHVDQWKNIMWICWWRNE